MASQRGKRSFSDGELRRAPPRVDSVPISTKGPKNIFRKIAEVLEPGESINDALRRLGRDRDEKGRMPAATRIVFEKLMDDSDELQSSGDKELKKEGFVLKGDEYEMQMSYAPVVPEPSQQPKPQPRLQLRAPPIRQPTPPQREFQISLNSLMKVTFSYTPNYGFTLHGPFFTDETKGADTKIPFIETMFYKESGCRYDDELIDGIHEVWCAVRDKNGLPKKPTEMDTIALVAHEWGKHGKFSGAQVDQLLRVLIQIAKDFRRDFTYAQNQPIRVGKVISNIKKIIGCTVRIRAFRMVSNPMYFSVDELTILYDETGRKLDMHEKFAGDLSSDDDLIVFE